MNDKLHNPTLQSGSSFERTNLNSWRILLLEFCKNLGAVYKIRLLKTEVYKSNVSKDVVSVAIFEDYNTYRRE